jgi:hypothetical protein
MIHERRPVGYFLRRSILAAAPVALFVLFSVVGKAKTEDPVALEGSKVAPQCDTAFLAQQFKYKVPVELGRDQTNDGGKIEIREVWGTRPQIEIGGQYLVRGTYVFPPGKHGMLHLYASANGPWGKTASLDLQSTAVEKREGEFALIHGMAGPGYFHLILVDADRYSNCFADVYFGTGDNVYRDKVGDASAQSSTPIIVSENWQAGPDGYEPVRAQPVR